MSHNQTEPQSDKSLATWLICYHYTGMQDVWIYCMHRNRLGMGDVALLPVQCGSRLAETHVCSRVEILYFLVVDQHCHWAGFIIITISFLFSLQSTQWGSLLCFDQIFKLLGCWLRSDRVSHMFPSTPVVPVRSVGVLKKALLKLNTQILSKNKSLNG